MKSSLTFLIGMALATTVHAQITVSHADSVHLGTVLGTGGNGFYGRNYLKNLTQGQASDSILVANADGLIRLVKRSTLAAPLTLQGVTNLGNSTTNNMGIGGSALTGGTSAHWLTVNGSVYSGGIIYAEGNAAKAYHYVDTDHMLAHQATSGIGQKFLVNGSNAPGMVLTTSGSVGIGTSDPDSKLTIRGDNPTVDIQANADHQKPGIFMRYQNNTYSGAQIYYQTIDAVTYFDNLYPTTDNILGSFSFRTQNASNLSTSRLFIRGKDGGIGMGTTAPEAQLHVIGGPDMPAGWKRTALLEAVYPVLAFNSTANGKYGGIGYDGGEGMAFWVHSSTANLSSVSPALMIRYDGKVGIGNATPTEKLSIAGNILADQYKLSNLNTAPANATDTGTKGEVRITADYIYVCIATNTWVRTALSTW